MIESKQTFKRKVRVKISTIFFKVSCVHGSVRFNVVLLRLQLYVKKGSAES